jgi:hypothetical protein
MKIKAWELKLFWEDGTENEVSSYLPEGTARDIEQFLDRWEQEYGQDEPKDEEEV